MTECGTERVRMNDSRGESEDGSESESEDHIEDEGPGQMRGPEWGAPRQSV